MLVDVLQYLDQVGVGIPDGCEVPQKLNLTPFPGPDIRWAADAGVFRPGQQGR